MFSRHSSDGAVGFEALRFVLILGLLVGSLFLLSAEQISPEGGGVPFSIAQPAHALTVTTTLAIHVCGNAIIEPPLEVCDDGINNGLYSSTIAGRNCEFDCESLAPYCGDNILQLIRGEACDDGNNVSGDGCSADCTVQENLPTEPDGGGGITGPFFGGGLSSPPPTRVIMSGYAYPNTTVTILKDGNVLGTTQAGSDASFRFETSNVTPGTASFGFWADDVNGLRSVTFTLTINVVSNAATAITGVVLPPTIGISESQVPVGDDALLFGTTLPLSEVHLAIDGSEETSVSTNASPSGGWNHPLDTSDLRVQEFHSIKALVRTVLNGQETESGFGRTISFFLGEGEGAVDFCLRADINEDGSVNLVDFSILLFNFGTANQGADINLDGSVNLTDFSVMLFCWSG